MKTLVAALLASITLHVHALPAFPGAEGFGSDTVGGRGGKVYYVTNLDNAGPGSLREAVEASGPRMVLFKVSGTIKLSHHLKITDPFITIAGHTAPGDGITLRGGSLRVATHDVVIRFIRSRLGSENPKQEDAISIDSGARRVVLDHVSASWSIDEALSPSGDIQDVTIQWSIISESLRKSVHSKGSHGYGSLLRATGGVSLHHNLWAHHDARNPRFGDNYFRGDAPTFDFRNNVIYGWGNMCSGLVDGAMQVNYINNYLKPNAQSSEDPPIVLNSKANEKTRFYLEGNVVLGRDLAHANAYFDTSMVNSAPGYSLASTPFITPAVKTDRAELAYARVLAHAGASLPARDTVDLRVIGQVKTGTGQMIDSPADVGGWPELQSAKAPQDSDSDGMPDDWEMAQGLDPKDPADGTKLRTDGYTELEHYLHSLVKLPEPISR